MVHRAGRQAVLHSVNVEFGLSSLPSLSSCSRFFCLSDRLHLSNLSNLSILCNQTLDKSEGQQCTPMAKQTLVLSSLARLLLPNHPKCPITKCKCDER